jgi:potassium channel LctB
MKNEKPKSFFVKALNFVLDKTIQFILCLIALICVSLIFIRISPWFLYVSLFLFSFYLLLSGVAFIYKGWLLFFDKKKSFPRLLFGYFSCVLGFVVIFSVIYISFTVLNLGYLSYGNCTATFNKELLLSGKITPLTDWVSMVYFSSITFFSVGYGDICPVGAHRIVSIFNAMAGHIFTAIILVLAMSYFVDYFMKRMRK